MFQTKKFVKEKKNLKQEKKTFLKYNDLIK